MATLKERNKIRKLIDGVKVGGFEYILYNITDRLPRWLAYYRHSLLLMHDINKTPLPDIDRDRTDYTFRMGTLADSASLEPFNISETMTREWLELGYTLFLALKGKQVVTYHWYARGDLFLAVSGTYFSTASDEVFGAGTATLADNRREGLFKGVYVRHREYYRDIGCTKSLATVNILNRGSIKAHEHLGYVTVGETYHFEFLGLAFTYYRSWPKPQRQMMIGLAGRRGNTTVA